ncbi:MAG: hypothetical protein WKG00_18365 [Polyangiaceae bacterium]
MLGPMPVTLFLFLLLAAVGIVDVGWYHLYRLRLYRDRRARVEQIAHSTRGVLFVAMLCLVVPATPQGRWVDVGLCLFVADFVNTIADTWVERGSRRGGLRHGEYMVHVAGSVLAGAAALAFAFEAVPMRPLPTALVARPLAPGWTAAAWLAVVGVAAVVVLEFALHLRARLTWRQAGVTS